MSITILAPKATGLADNQSHLPALVQGEFVSNFSGYSAISVLDWERLDELYLNLMSEKYDDKAREGLDLGNLAHTTHILGGSITKTPTGFSLRMHITKTSDKTTVASFTGNFTYWDLNNLTGIRQASLDLLQKVGVTLTTQAQQELTGAAMANHVSAQNALARGVTAQRQGTEVAALSYYFQAAAYNPSLREAVNRSSILNANITSGNIGDNVRNDIAWRKQWVERLTETEQYFDNFNKMESMPYTLFYLNDIKQGTIDYEKETVTMSIETYLYSSGIWTVSIERALQAVYDGLNATGRKDTWQLGGWPQRSVTDLKAFARRSKNFSVIFELLNNQNKIIGKQTLQTDGYWGLNWSGRPTIEISAPDRKTFRFQNVNANDVTDKMTIRVTGVNGVDAETAAINGVLQIRTITANDVVANDRFRFAKGEILGFANSDGRETRLVIPSTIWGDPVISIGAGAFKDNKKLNSVTIGANVIMDSNSFGGGGFYAFSDNYNQNGRQANTYYASRFRFVNGVIHGFLDKTSDNATNLVIPDTIWGNPVTSIGTGAFKNLGLQNITIPTSVKSIGSEAFWNRFNNNCGSRAQGGCAPPEMNITIGANVNMTGNPFRHSGNMLGGWISYENYNITSYDNDGFRKFYGQNGMMGGKYYTDHYEWRYSQAAGYENSESLIELLREKEETQAKSRKGVAILETIGSLLFLTGLIALIIFVPDKGN